MENEHPQAAGEPCAGPHGWRTLRMPALLVRSKARQNQKRQENKTQDQETVEVLKRGKASDLMASDEAGS